MDEVKENKCKELESARKAEELSPLTISIGTFEFDEDSQRRLTYAINALDDNQTRNWTLIDGSKIEVTKKILQSLFTTAIVRSDATFVKLKILKNLVKECKTWEEVAEITWDMDL